MNSTRIRRRIVTVIVLTVLTTAAVQYVHRIEPLTNEKLFDFPLQIGEWRGRDIPMEEWVFESLETDYAILRDYSLRDGNVVNLAVVWYDDKEIAFHAVEACLGGVGNKVKEKSQQVVAHKDESLMLGKLLVERSDQRLLVLYFYVSDGYVSPSQIEVRKHVLFRRLMMQRASAALVRIMISVNTDVQISQAVLERFVQETYPMLIDYTTFTPPI